MSRPIHSLDRIRITTPCDADWDSMVGNEQVRFCEHCHLQVNDLSAMTRFEAMRLVARSQGRLCVRYIQAPDGAPALPKLPQKLHRIGRRVSRIAAGAFSASLSLSTAAAQTRHEVNPTPPAEKAFIAKTVGPLETPINLTGVITDSDGAVVANATVSLTSPTAHLVYTYTTKEDGAYRFSPTDAGPFNLVAEAESFARTEKAGITLLPHVANVMNVIMDLPPLTAEVMVASNSDETQTVMMGGAAFAAPEDPLVNAAYRDDLSAVRQLVLTSENVNAFDKLTNTSALAYAVEHSNRDIVQALLSAGADVNARNSEGVSPLMYLGENASADLVKDLLSAGANPNSVDESGMTPLLQVAGNVPFQVVKTLLAAGADATAKDNEDTTVLMNAAGNADVRVLKLLLSAATDPGGQNENGETALMMAVRSGRADNVRVLLGTGIAVDAKDENGSTALMQAVANEEPEVTKLLLEKGADVNNKDEDGTTALALAAGQGKPATMKILIDAGAAVDARDDDGSTPLMKVVDTENALTLLKAGADLSIKNNQGQTALAIARHYEREEIVKLLVAWHAPE
jgi:ankyrin repeat protein